MSYTNLASSASNNILHNQAKLLPIGEQTTVSIYIAANAKTKKQANPQIISMVRKHKQQQDMKLAFRLFKHDVSQCMQVR